jgi:small-conductance mechanosensitive channel
MEALQALALEVFRSPYVQALLWVVGSLLAAKLIDFFITGALRRLARHTQTTLDDQIIDLLHSPVFLSVVLVGLYVAAGLLSPPGTVHMIVQGTLKTIAVLLWTGASLRITGMLLERLSRLADRVRWLDARTLPLFSNSAKVVIVGLAVYFLLLSWNIEVTAWLASAGIVGLALGLAAKDTLANLFGGLAILVDAPYKVGDFIMLDSGERGRVTKIGLRSTRILTRDDIEITIPNAQIANAKIVNESGGPWQKERVRVTVSVAYGSDVDRVREVLLETVRAVPEVSREPEPRVRFREFGESALIFQVLCWIDEPVLRGRAVDAINTAIYKKLRTEGIEIPFPQREVHIRSGPENPKSERSARRE